MEERHGKTQDRFRDQGGAATMDPGALRRLVTSSLLTRVCDPRRMARQRIRAEQRRASSGAPHRVEYFHQVDDGYSHLAAQLLAPLAQRYDIQLCCHLVSGPQGMNAPEPDLLLRLSRHDASRVAGAYGLRFPDHESAPSPGNVRLAAGILTAQRDDAAFVGLVADIGHALWTDDEAALQQLARQHGCASESATRERIATGTARREELGHYSGAMFHYGGEWYWGVDRLYHLERRFSELGIDRSPSRPLLAPRPAIAAPELKDSGRLTLEVYPSLRSPYTAISFDRALQLARETGVRLVVRPVLPMVMRGVPATRQKGLYIFWDCAREARAAGVPFGHVYDPIGDPVRRAYSLYPWAVRQGRGNELLSAFLRAAFADGVNTNRTRGLRHVVEQAGLGWQQARSHLGQTGWESPLEENRQSLYGAGLWGVPSFRLLDEAGGDILSLWGQDRLWLFAREIQRQLAARVHQNRLG